MTVGSDGAIHVHALVRHLIEDHGHRRIGLVGPRPGASSRLAGYGTALEEAGLEPGPYATTAASHDARAGYDAMAALLEQTPSAQRPTAVVAVNDLVAIGAMRCAVERGLRVPDEMAVVGFDGLP